MDQNSSSINLFILRCVSIHISQNISFERKPLPMDTDLCMQMQHNVSATEAAELHINVEITYKITF